MSVFSFLKTVGQKLVGGDDAPTPEALKKELDTHRLGTENVSVELAGDKVLLKGEVHDQATFEKAVLAVGNAHGIAEVDAKGLKVAYADAAEAVFYTVKPGDTLWKIAETHYGKGKGEKHNVIFEANKPMLTSPDKIYPGQMLRIPPLS